MGVTVIKLTGSQFCRVWIIKPYKMGKSKDIFLKRISHLTLWQSYLSLVTNVQEGTHVIGIKEDVAVAVVRLDFYMFLVRHKIHCCIVVV